MTGSARPTSSSIRRTCRADGVLVRPDVPIAAIDRAAFDAPVWTGEPLVASAHTQHSAGRWGYVFACNVGTDAAARTTHASRCASSVTIGPGTDSVAVFDWRTGRVEVLPADGAYDVALEPAGWDYRVARAGARRRHCRGR